MPRFDGMVQFCYVLGLSFDKGASVKRQAAPKKSASQGKRKLQINSTLSGSAKAKLIPPDPDAPAKLQQMKLYEEALMHFQQQKFQRAKESLERVIEGPSRELSD